MTPKVFVSHASEDKERFVVDFATKLRSKGIEAWFDQWEIYPGDSLVDKIFEEGIKEAQAVIVIKSKNSVNRPWVREELNVSVVRRINGISKLIPVVIDECEVPEALRSIAWIKIKDTSNYEKELERIVMSIYGLRDKPALGTAPSFTQTIMDALPDLTRIDTLVLKVACELAVATTNPWINPYEITAKVRSLDIAEQELSETVDVLDKRGYIRTLREAGVERVPMFSITLQGFEQYATSYIADYDEIVRMVIGQIINFDEHTNNAISSAINQPRMIVDHVLDVLDSRNLVSLVTVLTGEKRIYGFSPELKRMLS